MTRQESSPVDFDWQPPTEAEIAADLEEARRNLPQPEGDSPALFDRLFGILYRMRADTHPLDITASVDEQETSRVTLMALTDKGGTRRITQKWLHFIFPEDLADPKMGDEIPRGAHGVYTVQATVENDAIVMRERGMHQACDPETGLPIPGRFTGPAEFNVLSGYERMSTLRWLSTDIIELTKR